MRCGGVFRLDDIVEIERRKDDFSSKGNDTGGYRPKMPSDPALIGLDDPQHWTRRSLIARRFTPRAVRMLGDLVRDATVKLIDDALAHGNTIEVVDEMAAPLPATVIGKLLGFDDSMRASLQDWANRTIHLGGGPRAYNEDGIAAYMDFRAACEDLYQQRKAGPLQDDLLSIWIQAENDGLDDNTGFGMEEIMSDCLLMLDGGAETTRTVIGRGLMELADRPDQWELLKNGADLDLAVEEFIRYVTPIHNMCRVASHDTTIGGVAIAEGEQLVLQYASANRDESHFTNGETIDVTREKNPHISFGQGTHFCLGAALARQEVRIFLEEFVNRVDNLTVAQPIVEHPTAFVHGIASGHIDVTLA